MKQIVIFFSLLVMFTSSKLNAQTTPEEKVIHCEIVGYKFLGKMTVEIDMGQSTGVLGLNTSYITDENGKAKKFNSIIDALNFLGDNGWEFVQAYTIVINSVPETHYVLRQRIEKGADGKYYPSAKKWFSN